jgi:hypothetical protein
MYFRYSWPLLGHFSSITPMNIIKADVHGVTSIWSYGFYTSPPLLNTHTLTIQMWEIFSLSFNGMWALIGSVKLGVNVGIWLSCTTPIPIKPRESPENSKSVHCCNSRSNTRTFTDIQTHNDGNNRQNDTSMNAPTPSTSRWPGRNPSHTQTMHDARTHGHISAESSSETLRHTQVSGTETRPVNPAYRIQTMNWFTKGQPFHNRACKMMSDRCPYMYVGNCCDFWLCDCQLTTLYGKVAAKLRVSCELSDRL